MLNYANFDRKQVNKRPSVYFLKSGNNQSGTFTNSLLRNQIDQNYEYQEQRILR